MPPCPSTVLSPESLLNPDEPVCRPVWQYLYAGRCMCDPGYWCSCTSAHLNDCWPSNDSNTWSGHYTNETGVYIGRQYENRCDSTLYCPGEKDASHCPSLCPQGHYCPTSAEKIICPRGFFCPTGSVAPRKCPPFATCGEGEAIHDTWPLVLFAALACIASYLICTLGRYGLIRSARRRKMNVTSNNRKVKKQVSPLNLLTCNCTSPLYVAPNVDSHSESSISSRRGQVVSPIDSEAARGLGKPISTIQSIYIEIEGLRLTLPNGGPTILSEVNGIIPKGRITAIMGPSGAGKTTFLNVMAGKVKRTGGQVRVNGKLADFEEYKGIIGFMPQEDIMLPELTVEEVITHSAYMRLPQEMPAREKDAAIIDVINSLGLTGVMDSVIGDKLKRGISGGQRKRVNAAIEIVTKPSLLCLDEPTSGLDSVTSLSLVRALKGLATQGVTIVAVLHQPKYEIFELFDKVLLLGVGGCTVYLGPASDMKKYFEGLGFIIPPNANPADYCMDIVAGLVERKGHPDFVKEDLFDLWKEYCERPSTHMLVAHRRLYTSGMSNYMDLTNLEDDIQYTAWSGFKDILRLLLYRCMIQRLRTFSLIPFVVPTMIAVVLGVGNVSLDYHGIPDVLYDNIFGKAYLVQYENLQNGIPAIWIQMALAMVLLCTSGIQVFGRERAVFFREASTGLHVTAYWLAKLLDTLIWIIIYAFMFSSVIYTMSPFYLHFYEFWLIIFTAHVGYYATAMVASILISAAQRVLVAVVAGFILTFVFSGAVLQYVDGPLPEELYWIFFPFWNSQAFTSAMYKQLTEQNDIKYFNEPFHNESSFDRDIGFCVLTGVIVLYIFLAFSSACLTQVY